MNPAARDCVITRRGFWDSSVSHTYFFTKVMTSPLEAGAREEPESILRCNGAGTSQGGVKYSLFFDLEHIGDG